VSKVIDSIWFNTMQGSFGIILAEDETTGERKLYGGVSAGLNPQEDEKAILDWGNKVNLGMLATFMARTKPGLRKIELLKGLLESQEKDTGWDRLTPVIKASEKVEGDDLNLEIPEESISFVFDGTGEKFLSIVNWKE